MTTRPIQPLEYDERGVLRFKANAIVRHLLDHGGIDLNALACLPFGDEDRRQFAQLIGYSLSGYGELPYVDDASYLATAASYPLDLTPEEREALMRDITEVLSRAMVRWAARKAREAVEARGEEADRG